MVEQLLVFSKIMFLNIKLNNSQRTFSSLKLRDLEQNLFLYLKVQQVRGLEYVRYDFATFAFTQ